MSWDRRLVELAKHVAEWSKDPSTKVGAVIVNPDRTIVSLGFNGFPRGVEDTGPRIESRESKLRCTIHAEENAILTANQSLKGCFIFSSHFPCCACSARIIQSGLVKVCSARQTQYENRWQEDIAMGQKMMREAGVFYHYV